MGGAKGRWAVVCCHYCEIALADKLGKGLNLTLLSFEFELSLVCFITLHLHASVNHICKKRHRGCSLKTHYCEDSFSSTSLHFFSSNSSRLICSAYTDSVKLCLYCIHKSPVQHYHHTHTHTHTYKSGKSEINCVKIAMFYFQQRVVERAAF